LKKKKPPKSILLKARKLLSQEYDYAEKLWWRLNRGHLHERLKGEKDAYHEGGALKASKIAGRGKEQGGPLNISIKNEKGKNKKMAGEPSRVYQRIQGLFHKH